MRRIRLLVTVMVGLGLTAATVLASTFLSAEFREVVSEASTIVRGRVTDVRAMRSTAGDVESVVTIAVETALKGSGETFVSMRVPGGTIGRYRTVMPGAPVMRVGEQAVFFLKRGPGNSLWPVGLAQGIYRVSSSGGPVRMVQAPVLPGVTTNAVGVVVRGDVRRKALPLAEFESLVRLLLTRGAQ
ncbi:MAG TPA: hypothetical protein VMZ90_02150 [Vicinamibacterales bacterium]|nr:hypothetical protein [Vicinamibacterales bacterium]